MIVRAVCDKIILHQFFLTSIWTVMALQKERDSAKKKMEDHFLARQVFFVLKI